MKQMRGNDMVMVTITDASFAQESYMDKLGNEKAHRSQKARMNVLCSPTIFNEDVVDCHVISYASSTDKRVCSSTMQA